MKYIVDALKTKEVLEELELNRNDIEEVSLLKEMRETNKALTNLNLMGNKIIFINIEGLKVNTMLNELRLTFNELKNEGYKVISETLKISKGLKILDIVEIGADSQSAK